MSTIPRVFVNLVEPFNLALVNQLNKGGMCKLLHAYECRQIAFNEHNVPVAEGEHLDRLTEKLLLMDTTIP